MSTRLVLRTAKAYATLLVFFLIIYFSGAHGDTVLWVNGQRLASLDAVMPIWTHFGDGWFFSVAVIAMLLLRWRSGLVLLLLGVAQLLVSAVLKRGVFRGTPRPKVYFEQLGVPLDFIEGVTVHGHHAFPSGHSMTVFAIATFFLLYVRTGWVAMAGLFVAVTTAFSRIYLLQHFLIDVTIGSLIGVSLGTLVYGLFRKTLERDRISLGLSV